MTDTENENPNPEPVKGVDTGTGVRVDIDAVHEKIKKLQEELKAEVAKLGTEATHEVNMAHSYLDSAFMWIKKRINDLI